MIMWWLHLDKEQTGRVQPRSRGKHVSGRLESYISMFRDAACTLMNSLQISDWRWVCHCVIIYTSPRHITPNDFQGSCMQRWPVNNILKITEGRRGTKASRGGWCNNNESNKRRLIFPAVICASVNVYVSASECSCVRSHWAPKWVKMSHIILSITHLQYSTALCMCVCVAWGQNEVKQ